MRFNRHIALTLLPSLSLLLITACMRHRPQELPPPRLEVPQAYSTQAPEGSVDYLVWWEAFHDPLMADLIEEALSNNFTLAQAMTRIEQARAFVRQARALNKPQVGIGAGLERRWERNLESAPSDDPTVDEVLRDLRDFLEGDTAEAIGAGGEGDDTAFDRENWETSFDSGLTLQWELDLWGRLYALTGAERERLAALAQEYAALRLLISAQVAEAYYQALEQRLQLALLNEQQELAETFLELLELRFLQGSASAVDILQQRGQVAEIVAQVPVAQSQLGLLENRLDVLLGMPPDGVDRTSSGSASLPQELNFPQIGVPLDLLERRPDLQAARRRVAAQDYAVAAAIAERLPQVVLDGSFAFADTAGNASVAGSLAAGLFQPILDWGLRKAAVDAERAVLEEALLAYSEAFLVAIEEVETTLWQEARQRELIAALSAQEEILERTVEEAQVRYSLGVTDYLPVLTALQDLQGVQRDLLEERRALVSFRIQLHRAVGGGTERASRGSEERAEAAAPSLEIQDLQDPGLND